MITPLKRLLEEILKNKQGAILISSVSNITYLTNYSGFSKEEREAYLLIVTRPQRLTHKTSKVLGYILTDGRYSTAVKTLIPNFKLIEISPKLPFEKAFKKLAKKHDIKRLGIEENNLTYEEYKKLSLCFNDLPRRKAGLNHLDLTNLRIIKTTEEIKKIEKACGLGDKTFDYILKKIRLGVSEKEISREIEFFIKKNGADISFPPIVAFGKNSAIPHHQATNNQLTNNQIVLLDFGVKLNNYCSDMTRTIFFGKAPAEFKKIYKTVLSAQSHAIDTLNSLFMIHDSVPAKDIDKTAREYIISQDYKTIPHSLGHGIGLEVHESPSLSPNSKNILKEGMVFSIEPGIYLPARNASQPASQAERGGQGASVAGGPDFGGVRIEDLAVLEKEGLRLLTKSPKNITII